LIATPDEHKALQMNYTDHTTKGEKINKADLTKLTDEELTILIELQSKSGTSET
jgi:hypothetical protein